ncbi:MAG: FAD-binding protein [Bacteroidales bacterium]|nr:FAD-binding protein [Bacteroidales bacterium]
MIIDSTYRLSPQDAASDATIRALIARDHRLKKGQISSIRILKRSIDARQRNVFVNLTVRAYVDEPCIEELYTSITYPDVSHAKQVIVVGAGPGGLFAALRLIEGGMKPIVLERGQDVHERRKDIAQISREHQVNPESNYSFGEGGAGAFSDGKLYTRSKKRGSVDRILNIFCDHGADTHILIDAHPHIGTDKLPGVIENMRKKILDRGGEVHFKTRVDALCIKKNCVTGVITSDGKEYTGPVILATGHSARDVYRWLHAAEVEMESKGIAVGVRLEHPQAIIDAIQYHNPAGRGAYLPAAEYSYVTQVRDRGVYSFCMCPGGVVVPAASGPEQVVVNGMSASSRGSRWANSGMVVEVRPEDVAVYGNDPVLSVLQFQEELERLSWINGGRRQTAPAQRMGDFINRRNSANLPDSSYTPGVVSSPLHFWMPEFVANRLQQGFSHFGTTSRGFLTNEALLIGVETRTSAPIRILRDKDTLCHIRLQGLYPCGEGAGYAGGIVSAAIDGERCAESILENSK